MGEIIKVLIVDDHPIVRKGLCDLIEFSPDICVIGEAANGAEVIRLAQTLNPDIVLLDLVMPGMDGIDIITRLKSDHPDLRILILTSFSEDEKVIAAIKAGAQGYMLKDSSPQDVLQALREVYRGKSFLSPVIARKLIREMNQPMPTPAENEVLTERETEILTMIAKGMTNQEIADWFVISRKTVITHVSKILAKLHLTNRTQAALYAVQIGMVKPDSE
jgi:two-component system, NarL family, response regulator LiaR